MFSASTKSAHPSGAVNWIDDVFSTYLYTGNGSTQTITNGIDLATKGGMVWIKSRSNAQDNCISDSALGIGSGGYYSRLITNSTAAANTAITGGPSAFNSNGWSGGGGTSQWNSSGATYASWTFAKQAKFFDVVTYTGTGSNRTIAHNLGSVPGCIIVKCTSLAGEDWRIYHTSLGATKAIRFTTDAAVTNSTYWNNTNPTSTVFTVGTNSSVNQSGATYVAYLFAHDAGGFGTSGTDNVISCGSFSCSPSGTATVNLGYEPQWILAKDAANVGSWELFDNMRGMNYSATEELVANTAGASYTYNPGVVIPTATGFTVTSSSPFGASSNIIYIAIRRPMKPPTTGTSVFMPIAQNGGNGTGVVTTNFPVDFSLSKLRGYVGSTMAVDRLRGSLSTGPMARLFTADTSAEASNLSYGFGFDNNNGYLDNWYSANPAVYWNFRRAPGFFDEVCYTGTGAATTQAHNLGVAPELMFVKQRSAGSNKNWMVYSSSQGISMLAHLNTNDQFYNPGVPVWGASNPTSSVFSVGAGFDVNDASATYVAYLFATVAGVSKVGSYTGTGTTNQINCGFTGGARFVLIKRTDSTGDWYVWDSARGIVSGNDPYLLLNSTAAEVTNTDYVDTYSAGFEISSTAPAGINANGGSYIYLAIA